MVFSEVIQTCPQEAQKIGMVVLKELNCSCPERYYYIRPCQPIGSEVFHSHKIKQVYCYVKVLKNMFNIDNINMYLLKKILRKPLLLSLDVLPFGRLLYSILSLPDIKPKFQHRIDYAKWEKTFALSTYVIPFKKGPSPAAKS